MTPEDFEARSWAAWWRDDEPLVFSARERAYRLYEAAGDAAGAARMAVWLACDEMDFHGAAAVANGWLARAHRLLDGLDPVPEHGWLAFHEGYLAYAGGATDTALARRTAELGRRLGVRDLEMLGLALEGAALVSCACVDEGMRCLDEATALALDGDAAIPISGAWACCFLVGACIAVLDLDRAVQWCDRIAAFADRHGSRYMLAFCRAEYGAVHVWRGRWADAEALLAAAVEDFARSRPAWVDGPLTGLAELRRRQGRLDEAAALLERAPSKLYEARIALDRGRPRDAVDLLERLLRQLPAERRLARAPALQTLVEARVARGELDAAAAAAEQLGEIADLAGTRMLGACAGRAAGIVAAAGGDHGRAKALLEDALDAFAGAPFEAARTRRALAQTLHALGRTEAAAREADAAGAALAALGAPHEPFAANGLARLTRREHEVLCLLADGLTNRQIAERLVVSEHTVHRHVAHVLRKLDAPSRTAAASQAVRAGLG